MIRGTTPTLRFALPFKTETLEEAYITFMQDKEMIIEKTLKDCEKQEEALEMRLTQEDTLKFKEDRAVEIQIRARTWGGDAIASVIMRTQAKRILKDGVI